MMNVYVLTSRYDDEFAIDTVVGVYTTLEAAKTAVAIASGVTDLGWQVQNRQLGPYVLPYQERAYANKSVYNVEEHALNWNPESPQEMNE